MKKTKKKNTKAKAVKKVVKKACKKCKKGFTLIELLVVVAIIGILAGIVVISTNSARTRTVKASLLSTMASVATTARVCDNEDGVVTAPKHETNGGGPICTGDGMDDINEEWPALPAEIYNAGYKYGSVSDTELTAVNEAGTPIVTCAVATGSCRVN